MTSIALGLAPREKDGCRDPSVFDRALPPRRLADIDDTSVILRDARCIGGLSNEALDNPHVLRERFVEWGEELAGMTTALNNGEYEDRDRLCGKILRSAHGLAGSIIHLLDVAGVDVVRELRVPTTLDHAQLASLAKTVSISTAIQSQYGEFAVWRQLYEARREKRQDVPTPTINADDPTGEFIGGLVVRGPSANRLGQHLEAMLSNPAPLHEDAPEFVVPISVTTVDRSAYATAATRMLRRKNLRSTTAAVTLFHTLAASPYAVTEAISGLQSEDQTRRIRLDEVRVALATLSANQLLPESKPTVSDAVGALLRSAKPLTKTQLVEKADISRKSIKRNEDVLIALDLVRHTPSGYRLSLPFSNDDERGDHIAPKPVTNDVGIQAVLFDVVISLVRDDEAGRLGDPSDPLGAPFFGPTAKPAEIRALSAVLPVLNPWIETIKRLCNSAKSSSTTTVTIGPQVNQTSLQALT